MIGIEARVLLPLDDGVLDLCELGRLLAALEGASQVSAAARRSGAGRRAPASGPREDQPLNFQRLE